jgi:hypothetical protein
MQDKLCEFIYRRDSTRILPFPTYLTSHLAEVVLEVNSLYLNSKHSFQSYIVNIYSEGMGYGIDAVSTFCDNITDLLVLTRAGN